MLNGLDLFSGIGGISLALRPWVRTVAYCEKNRYAQAVLLSRMRDDSICRAPIWDDVQTLRGDMLAGGIDLISGGFPCQDISIAGNGVGLGGSRSGLFFEIARLARELRPRFLFLENVPALTIRGLDRVLLELTSLGFDSRWTIVSAAEMGAPHIRERIWILAHANDPGHGRQTELHADSRRPATMQQRSNALDLSGDHVRTWDATRAPKGEVKPRVDRAGDGLPNRSHRCFALGNSVDARAAREAFMRLIGISQHERYEAKGKE